MYGLNALSWNNPKSVQEKAVRQMAAGTDAAWRTFILPYRKKDCWQNCARVLALQSDDVLISLDDQIYEWFQDMNWPGAALLSHRLNTIPREKRWHGFTLAKERAIRGGDEEWLLNLIEEFSPHDT